MTSKPDFRGEAKRSDGRAAEYQSFQMMVFKPLKGAELVLKGGSLSVEIAANLTEPAFSAWKAHMASITDYTHNMARFVWQMTAYPWNKDLDNWLAAEKYSRTIAALATIVPSVSGVYVSTLASEGTYQKYFDYVRQLAYEMWMRSIISQSSTLARDAWVAAERHLLIVMGAALRTAESVDEVTYILTRLFKNFDPVLHLARIEKEAYSLWEARGMPLRDALRDWIKAEEAILAQIGKGEIKAIASPDTENNVR